MQISGKGNQYTLEVANSTPETDEDSIARAQAHLNTLLVIWGSRLTFKRLGGTVGKQGSGQKQEWFVIGVQQLGVTARGEISWDMVRDTLIREVTFGVPPALQMKCAASWLNSYSAFHSLDSTGALLGYDPTANGTGTIPLSVKKATVRHFTRHPGD